MLPRLNQSLCGCSLYTGCLILGWLYTLASIFIFGAVVFGFLGPAYFSIAVINATTEGGHSQEEVDALLFSARMLYGMVLSVCILGVFINGCFLYGVYKRNHCLMMPHLIFTGIGICMSVLSNVILLILAFSSLQYFIKFIFHFLETAIGAYLWILMYSYFMEVKEEALMNQNTLNKI